MERYYHSLLVAFEHDLHPNSLLEFIKNGIVSPFFDAKYTDLKGSTLLHILCDKIDIDDYCKHQKAFMEMIGALICAGVNVNHQNMDGNTCLHLISKKRLILFMRLLIQSGAHGNVNNRAGEVPLTYISDDRFLPLYKNRATKFDNFIETNSSLSWKLVKVHFVTPGVAQNSGGVFNICEIELMSVNDETGYHLMMGISKKVVHYHAKTRDGIFSDEDGPEYAVNHLKEIFIKYRIPYIGELLMNDETTFTCTESDPEEQYSDAENIEMAEEGVDGLVGHGMIQAYKGRYREICNKLVYRELIPYLPMAPGKK